MLSRAPRAGISGCRALLSHTTTQQQQAALVSVLWRNLITQAWTFLFDTSGGRRQEIPYPLMAPLPPEAKGWILTEYGVFKDNGLSPCSIRNNIWKHWITSPLVGAFPQGFMPTLLSESQIKTKRCPPYVKQRLFHHFTPKRRRTSVSQTSLQ